MELMRLQIRAPWCVLKNCFYDADPDIVDGRLVPTEWIEDILSLEQHPPGSPHPGYLIDLGWYPDSDPEGAYRLVLLRTWEDILDQLVSPDRFAIRERLERWMDQIARAKDRAQLERWLEADR